MAGLLDFEDPNTVGALQFGMGLLNAGGPSRMPVSFGQGIAQAGIGAMDAMRQARGDQQKKQLFQMQMEKGGIEMSAMKDKLLEDKKLKDLLESFASQLPPDQQAAFRVDPKGFIESKRNEAEMKAFQASQTPQPSANLTGFEPLSATQQGAPFAGAQGMVGNASQLVQDIASRQDISPEDKQGILNQIRLQQQSGATTPQIPPGLFSPNKMIQAATKFQIGEQDKKDALASNQALQREFETGRNRRFDTGQQGLGERQQIGIDAAVERAKTSMGAPLSPAELASAGAQIAAGQPITQVIPGYGKGAQDRREEARKEAIEQIRAANPGMDNKQAGQELAMRSIGFKADSGSVQQLTKMEGATIPVVKQLNYNIDRTTEILKSLGGRDISPVINAIADNVSVWTGDPRFASLFFHLQGAAIEAARMRSGGQASVAQLHAGAVEEAKKWSSSHMTPETWADIAKAMKDEGAEKLKFYTQAREVMKDRSVGKNTVSPAPTFGNVQSQIPTEQPSVRKYNPATGRIE